MFETHSGEKNINPYVSENPCQIAWEGMVDIQSEHYITGDTAFGVDRLGVIVLWNRAAEDSLGFPASKALGQKCWELLSGQDQNGNRYCCEHCPLREMNFRHEPVHGFRRTFKTASKQTRQFDVSWLTVIDEPGNEMLLHICRPDIKQLDAGNDFAADLKPVLDELGTLSQRETEILKLLAEKVSTQNIAASMSISTRTVRTHIQHLMYKLRVHKRREAIEVAKHLKLI
jgi:PAS domain S-box-containing protein